MLSPFFYYFFTLSCSGKKKAVPSALADRDDSMRGSTLIAPAYAGTTSLDDNGITGPDWGHSEVVFKCFP